MKILRHREEVGDGFNVGLFRRCCFGSPGAMTAQPPVEEQSRTQGNRSTLNAAKRAKRAIMLN